MIHTTGAEDKLLDDLNEILHIRWYSRIESMVDRLDSEIIDRDERIEVLSRRILALIESIEKLEIEIDTLQGNLLDK